MGSHIRLKSSPGCKEQLAAAIQKLQWSCLGLKHLMEMDRNLNEIMKLNENTALKLEIFQP